MFSLRFIHRQYCTRLKTYVRCFYHRSCYYHSLGNTKEALYCDIDAEPVHRYRNGGYHPVHLGDTLKSRRYKILHKLGWGGYSTVWLAKDYQLNRLVSIKIMISELNRDHKEASKYRRLSLGPASHPGRRHLPELLDDFQLHGPNGVHHCLVTEVLGPAIPSVIEQCANDRLPGGVAWRVAKQVVQAVTYMHHMGIAHGDIHPGNIVFASDQVSRMPDDELLLSMGKPETGDIHATRGQVLTNSVPHYLVFPSAVVSSILSLEQCTIKRIDFGSAILSGDPSPKMRCPLPFRAPEVVLTARWDINADVWSLACTIFALVVGYPPFDSLLVNEEEMVHQWTATFGDLPKEWNYNPPSHGHSSEIEPTGLGEWLFETYYDDGKRPFFSKDELQAIGQMLQAIMRFQPSERPSAEEIMLDPLFHEEAFADRATSSTRECLSPRTKPL